MPATLSLAEARGLSGKDLIVAFVLGVEVAAKIGSVMGRSHYQTGWHPTGTVGTVAAAAGAAKIIGLPKRQAVHALGIACSSAAGLRENFGTSTKSLHAGNAASMGITSALLAKGGYDSSLTALDGNEGFIKAMQGEPDGKLPVKELGQPYSLLRVQVKKYPSCTGTHAAIDAILRFMDSGSIAPKGVEAIVIETRTQNRSVLRFPEPRTELQAKFSLEYCAAAALIHGRLSPREFGRGAVSNSKVRDFMKKISVVYSSEMEDLAHQKQLISPTRTTIVLRNGQRVSQLIEEARGGYREPLSWSEIEEKFLECTKRLKLAKQFIQRIKCLEQEKNITALMGILS
jgi:2-methylcitrate dehydratase PrpD